MNERQSTNHLANVILKAIDKLPIKYRLPIWLVHYEDLNLYEVSYALEISEKVVTHRIFKGLAKLKKILMHPYPTLSTETMVKLMHETPLEAPPHGILQKILHHSIYATQS